MSQVDSTKVGAVLATSDDDVHVTTPPHKAKFRFKSSGQDLKRETDLDDSEEASSRRQKRRDRYGLGYSKRHKTSPPPNDPSLCDGTQLPDTYPNQTMDADTAFRESLFDAMADDEGAKFWEGVYGQPIPRIPRFRQSHDGKLEAMTEDEYAAYVRAEMYKKTHEYLIGEAARRRDAQRRDALRKEEREALDYLLQNAARQQALGEDERMEKERDEKAQLSADWARKWSEYQRSWQGIGNHNHVGSLKIPWPVWRGRRADINKEEIKKFFLNGPTAGNPDQADLFTTLKAERVRWHPDKVQQKLGEYGLSEGRMRAVTAIFQIVDRMWIELRDKSR